MSEGLGGNGDGSGGEGLGGDGEGGGGESGGGEGGGESGGSRQLPRTQSGQQLARAMMGINIRRREEQGQQAGQDVESGGVTAQPQPQGSAGGGSQQGGGERSASEKERAAEQRQALIRAKRARTRWHLDRTLLNNPGLVAERADARESASAAAAARAAAEAKGESSMAEMVHDAMAVALGLD